MKKLRMFLLSLAGVVAMASAIVWADTGFYFPIPGNVIGSAGQVLVAKDTNNVTANTVFFSATINPGSIAAETCAYQSFTVTGIAATDAVSVSGPHPTDGILDSSYGAVSAKPSGADTVAINFCNPTEVVVDPASSTYRFLAIGAAG